MRLTYSAAGPLLRGSGVPYDVRRADPYSIYPELDFDVITENAGDMYARYKVRVQEMYESVRILKQLLPRLEYTAGEPVSENNMANTPVKYPWVKHMAV